MNQQRWQQIKTALYEALELRRELRPGYIAKATADDTELRGELESLIAAHDAASDDFLNTPAAASGAFAEAPGPDPWVGKHIGPYQLIEEIGSGGMGEVYRAVRADDAYQKQVAIKLIRAGQDSAFVVQRFRNERQILASFEHPNIARLLDGGSTAEGLPYFVMELIRGEPIDRYCDHHRLDTTARLRLFLQVCAAVQYAHQRLIIHRDLKPSNILVKDDGVPVLLDFGIAKIIESGGAAPLPQQTLLRLMTPDYASPEQLNGEALTTASDVYSLGVVLYELLTGLRPNHAAAVSQSLVATLSRPATVKPSTAAGRAADSSGIREGTARRLRRRLRGDLDNILLMALRPEPNRRYDSVELFAEDIRRHLASLPVHARRATFGYRTSRFIVRYAAGLMVAFVLAVALIVGLLITARAERAAQAQRLRAEHERNAAEFALAGQFEERAWAALHDGYRTEAARDALAAVSLARPLGMRFHSILMAELAEPKFLSLEHDAVVEFVAVSADGLRVATASADKTARIWDSLSGRELAKLQHDKIVRTAVFSPDGARVVTASDDKTARIWDANSGREILRLLHQDRVEYAEFSPDGARVVSASMDRSARIWDASSGKELLRLPHAAGLWRAQFSPDGTRVLTTPSDHAALMWDAQTGRELARFRHDDSVVAARFCSDGSKVATASRDNTARIWDAGTGREIARLRHAGTVWVAEFSADCARVLTASDDKTARIWNARTGQELVRLQHPVWVQSARFSPDGSRVVSTAGKTLRIWDAATGSELGRMWHDSGIIGIPAFTPDGARVVSASDDGTARIWELKTGPELARLTHDSYVWAAAFSPDGNRVVTASWDKTAGIWDAASGRQLERLPHDDRLATAMFSPDGTRVLAASMDGTARIWEAGTGRELIRLKHDAGLWTATYSRGRRSRRDRLNGSNRASLGRPNRARTCPCDFRRPGAQYRLFSARRLPRDRRRRQNLARLGSQGEARDRARRIRQQRAKPRLLAGRRPDCRRVSGSCCAHSRRQDGSGNCPPTARWGGQRREVFRERCADRDRVGR